MGFETPGGRFVDMNFRSAYLSAPAYGQERVYRCASTSSTPTTIRVLSLGDTNEQGWAATAAWRYPLTQILDVRLEALEVGSTRPGRTLAGEAPTQLQTVLQSSLRLSF